jgi:formylglycine-generating enzyme required for sulfatase activity
VWVEIPAGEFWMGGEQYSHEKPVHKVHLERYWMAKTPVTNAQYRLFVEATGRKAPMHWENGKIPRGLENHPVVNVTWHDALAYCRWLSEVIGKPISLPSEAEWEKAARGAKDKREYPWGNTFAKDKCNSEESGIKGTTPVGKYSPAGDSPFGCADMVGNVWEWTRSLWGKDWQKPEFKYLYDPHDGREKLEAADNVRRVLRGGAFNNSRSYARCAYRDWDLPLST